MPQLLDTRSQVGYSQSTCLKGIIQPFEEEPGLKEFLNDAGLNSDASEEEIAFLRKLRFKTKRPTPLYYYRELQSLRDPLHFRTR